MTLRRTLHALARAVFNKNILIFVLLISAVYLSGTLWFERISSSRNFFYAIAEAVAQTPALPTDFEQPFVEPMRIVTGFGNRSYSVDYITEGAIAAHSSFIALRAAVSNAEYSHTSELDWPELLSSAAYLIEYPLRLPRGLVSGAWGVRESDSAIMRHVLAFDTIVIAPGITSADGITITFVDSAQALTHHFVLDDDALRSDLRNEIIAAQDQVADIHFSASSEVAAHMFYGNAFIPIFSGDTLMYTPLRVTNPYANASGDVLISSIIPRISALFETPAAITSKVNPGEFIFSDEHTVVRFSAGNILEYSNYRTHRQPRALTLGEAYGVARAFIGRDAQIPGRAYLTGFTEYEGTFTFYFGLAVYNFPLIMPAGFAQMHNLTAPIEVSVRGGIVANYRKWGTGFEPSLAGQVADIGFFSAYDQLIDSGVMRSIIAGSIPYIHGADLAFYADLDNLDEIGLVWYIRIDGAPYIAPTR